MRIAFTQWIQSPNTRPQRHERERDRDRLHQRLELAARRRGNDVAATELDEPPHRDADLAHHDDRGDPPGQLAEDRQAHERSAGEQLVGDRIEDLAEVGDEPARARDVAVEAVGRDRDDEHRCRGPAQPAVVAAVGEQHPEEHRREQDAHDRDGVGKVPVRRSRGAVGGIRHRANCTRRRMTRHGLARARGQSRPVSPQASSSGSASTSGRFCVRLATGSSS